MPEKWFSRIKKINNSYIIVIIIITILAFWDELPWRTVKGSALK
jgi:hypothetical protein